MSAISVFYTQKHTPGVKSSVPLFLHPFPFSRDCEKLGGAISDKPNFY